MSSGEGKCLFGPCNAPGTLQIFKTQAVQKIVATSNAKQDELYTNLAETDILAYKSCYCSYTSMSRNNENRKRKSTEGNIVSERLLKSQCSDFNFKRDLLCGNECKLKDSKNPHRWVTVRKCTTVERGSAITFKQQLENFCNERQEQWVNEVAARLSGVIDLHAADAQYHAHCYDSFRPRSTCPPIIEPDEMALRSVISTMTENMTETWTTAELFSKYLSASGTLSKKQFVSSVTSHFGEELLMFHIEGCASVVGFKANLGKVIKIVKISKSTDGDDELEKLVRKIRSEVMATPRPGDYNLNHSSKGHREHQ